MCCDRSELLPLDSLFNFCWENYKVNNLHLIVENVSVVIMIITVIFQLYLS